MISTIRSYLKLYTSIEMKKLAAFVDMDVDTFRCVCGHGWLLVVIGGCL